MPRYLDEITPADRIDASRSLLMDILPYLSMVLLRMSFVEYRKEGFRAGITKQGVTYWNPDVFVELMVPECAFIVGHECLHFALGHNDRKEAYERALGPVDNNIWNRAADVVVNDILLDSDLPAPKNIVTSKTEKVPKGLDVEQYYELLLKKKKEGSKPSKATCGFGFGKCGSCAGDPLPGEEEVQGSGEENYVDPEAVAKAISDAPTQPQIESFRVQVAIAAEDFYKSRGTVPGEISAFAEGVLKPPKIPWQSELYAEAALAEGFDLGAGRLDYRYPNRRQPAYTPGSLTPILPRVRGPRTRGVIGLDTSGSVWSDKFLDFCAEGEAILNQTHMDLTLIACDAAVQKVCQVKSVEDFRNSFVGRGGTDFAPIFKYVLEEMDPQPTLLILFTDAEGPAYPARLIPNTLRVIFCISNSNKGVRPWDPETSRPVTYGRFIYMQE